ncbi:MAG TPA: ATP-binding protein [Kofleriaceae bacterium]|nr:ATP-binding protein [Kofleriaceae bacterium]
MARLRFRHRIGLLLALAAVALIAVTVVTLALGRSSERQLVGIETRYVPLIELNGDLKRMASELSKAFEDAADAGEESKLAEAEQLRAAFRARIDAGRSVIARNGADPDALLAALDRFAEAARPLSVELIRGRPASELTTEIGVMVQTRRDFLALINAATTPDRARMTDAFARARAVQRTALVVNIVVALATLAIMALLSWHLIRRTVRSLQAVSEGVERLARGDFATPIDVPPGDEIGDLAREANRTADRLREYREQAAREAQAAATANKELEAFSYSVSHDLRAPLRGIAGFSLALVEDESDKLSPKGHDYLNRIRAGAQRMGELIDDLLRLSRVSRADFKKERVDVSSLATLVVEDLRKSAPERSVAVDIQPNVSASADPRLLRIVLENLIGNAWKFTSKTESAKIEVGARDDDSEGGKQRVYFVRDNGAGFDMKYAERLFAAFQRLHSDKEFPGTGIGLATVQRIVIRHGGRIWVEAAPSAGATFQFTLPRGSD